MLMTKIFKTHSFVKFRTVFVSRGGRRAAEVVNRKGMFHRAPNGDLAIPAILVAGKYLLENIRLTHDGETLFVAEPSTVPIEVIEEILIRGVGWAVPTITWFNEGFGSASLDPT
jgi:hypothetical protein